MHSNQPHIIETNILLEELSFILHLALESKRINLPRGNTLATDSIACVKWNTSSLPICAMEKISDIVVAYMEDVLHFLNKYPLFYDQQFL